MEIHRGSNLIPFTPLYTVEYGLIQGLPIATILSQGKSENVNVYDLMRTFSYYKYFVQHCRFPYDEHNSILLVRVSLQPIPKNLYNRHKMLLQELLHLNQYHFINDLDFSIKQLPTYKEMLNLPASLITWDLFNINPV